MKKFFAFLIVTSFAVVGSLGAAEAGYKKKHRPAVTSSATGLTVVGAAAANGEAIGGGLIVGRRNPLQTKAAKAATLQLAVQLKAPLTARKVDVVAEVHQCEAKEHAVAQPKAHRFHLVGLDTQKLV